MTTKQVDRLERIIEAKDIGRILRLTRDAQGIRQADMALILDVAQSTLVRLEAGDVARPIRTLLKALGDLGIRMYLQPPDELVEGKSYVRSLAKLESLASKPGQGKSLYKYFTNTRRKRSPSR